MAKCSYCGTRIYIGGKRDGEFRFCNNECKENGALIRLSSQLPDQMLEKAVRATHSGDCPQCQGSGPVDVHISHRVWSALFMTSWSSRPQMSCASCGWKAKVGDAFFCFFLGWWGFPWGLIVTPIQIGRNLIGLANAPDPTRPTPSLLNFVGIQLALSVLQEQQGLADKATPLTGPS